MRADHVSTPSNRWCGPGSQKKRGPLGPLLESPTLAALMAPVLALPRNVPVSPVGVTTSAQTVKYRILLHGVLSAGKVGGDRTPSRLTLGLRRVVGLGREMIACGLRGLGVNRPCRVFGLGGAREIRTQVRPKPLCVDVELLGEGLGRDRGVGCHVVGHPLSCVAFVDHAPIVSRPRHHVNTQLQHESTQFHVYVGTPP